MSRRGEVDEILGRSTALLVAGSVGAGLVVGGYLLSFQGGISIDQAVWGQFGDFVGGLLNPFLALLALIVLGHTVRLQGMQMKAAEEDVRKQRFEATAAVWCNMWLDSLSSIREGNASGVEAVRSLLDAQLAPGLRRARIAFPGSSDAEVLSAGVAEFMVGPGDKVRHYLATLGVLARFLQRGPEGLSDQYMELLRARLSSGERQLVAACWSGGFREWAPGGANIVGSLLGQRGVEPLGPGLPPLESGF